MPYKPIPPNSETYSQAIEAFISLGETRSPSLDFPPLPEAERQRLKLEKLEIQSYPQADVLIGQVINKTIDITTPAGRQKFVTDWQAQCPNLPIPCVPDTNGDWTKGKYWYLKQLAQGKIITNLSDRKDDKGNPIENIPATPRFGQDKILYYDNSFIEEDWDTLDLTDPTKKKMQTVISPLLQEFLGPQQIGVVSIKREDIDNALWDGDPANRKPTAKHQQILTSLGLNPTQYEFRCIRQDEYARASTSQNWGQKNLATNFDHYFEDGVHNGLYGGYRTVGGPSYVTSTSYGFPSVNLSVRLVLSRKQI